MDRRDFIKVGIGALATLEVGEVIRLFPGAIAEATAPAPRVKRRPGEKAIPKVPNDYSRAQRVPSVCLNCSTVCGIVGYVIDGKLVKVGGNPEDPNNGKTLCAKGQSGPTINDYPERLLYPLKRVGKRGEGLWQRITWDEAYEEIARRVRKCLDEGHPEQVAIHYGRSRISDVVERFQNAIGSPVILNHRALCSLNKRAANYACIGDTDWETVDAEHSKYLLNFGSNFYEAHQGSIHFLRRVVRGRFDNGAKLVTFDVRLSNTAGRSDEWHAPFPGTEGAVALAMAHTMMKEGEYDREWITKWTNVTPDALWKFLEQYPPEWAAKVSGIPAREIRRIALDFARARPHCAAWTNRGSHAHYNGFNNDRAVVLLNALAGNIGKRGGYCYGEAERVDPVKFPPPAPLPPRPKIRTDLEDPPEWPIANLWQKMRVGQIVYDYIQQRRALVQVYLSYTLGSPLTWPEGRSLAVEVLKDEELIPFHACSDIVYSEMAHYADLILPDASYMERWGLDTRNNYELRPYVTLRQPIVPPPAECVHFADVLIELGRRCGPDVAKYFPFKSHEEYVAHQCRNVPPGDAESGFEYMKKHGVYMDESQPKTYELYSRPLTPEELKEATDARTGTDEQLRDVYYRKNVANGQMEAVGVKVDGEVRRGFKTPSRKFEVWSKPVVEQSKKVGIEDDGWPHYVPIPAHEELPEDRFIFTTFKWNVHTQARTAPQKYLSEIVHSNPMWINTRTARKLGIKTGDWVEVTTYRPRGKTHRATGEKLGSVRVQAFVTEGIHPRVLAVSNSLGFEHGGRAATAERGPRPEGPGYDPAVLPEDPDLSENLWWDRDHRGVGPGFNVNAVLPIQPSPVTGMQAWFDTVCTIRKV
ncbi:MAG: molybdopterin-dependent oxidoreductase [Armatimonadota bacterium]